MTSSTDRSPFRSAFIALIGRPNSGKSTLLNNVIGDEVSIVSALPQTTRGSTRGIFTTNTMQLVFVDTPGIHHGRHLMNHAMLQDACRAVADDVDLICYLVDLSREYAEEETAAADLVRSIKGVPVLIVFNKTDMTKRVDDAVERFHRLFPDLATLPSVRLSAVHPDAKKLFLASVDPFIPEGPRYFDPDELTDSTMRRIAAEHIRKQVIAAAGNEVPHATFVEIESYRETPQRHEIIATIHVETRGQRGIIVGKGGSVISRIKKAARGSIMNLAGVPVSLTCHVKVSPRWRDNKDFLRRVGVDWGGVMPHQHSDEASGVPPGQKKNLSRC
ncbi:MAG: GTPase Era [Chitinispirillaceae bacterium]|nr:GTPase Era [Chitinispirillaceae bacterium]